jgi:hypothetical protein
MVAVLSFDSAEAAEPAKAAAPAKPSSPAKPAAKGKGKGKGGGTAAELTQLLQSKGSEVQECAVQHALDKGSSKVEISTHVTINGRGQVINVKTQVVLDKGEGDNVRDCIDKLIKSIPFPNSASPMITIERNWTIKSA